VLRLHRPVESLVSHVTVVDAVEAVIAACPSVAMTVVTELDAWVVAASRPRSLHVCEECDAALNGDVTGAETFVST
jgi:hypothetical protein